MVRVPSFAFVLFALTSLPSAAQVANVSDASESSADAIPISTTCLPTSSNLCLNGGRFQVEANWRTPDGNNGRGEVVKLTNETGYLWFFSPDNVEVVVKVLNGCTFNNRYWVFAAGLTNVEVAITVTDTQRGNVRTYFNPQGRAFAPIQDTGAFATCP